MTLHRTLLLIIAAAAASPAGRVAPSAAIKLDQAGYLPQASKLAFVVSREPASDFSVHRLDDGSLAFHGQLSPPTADRDSGDSVQTADFTGLCDAGIYFLDVPGVGRSWNFAIGPDVYARALYLTTRSFYGQRCGTAVDLGPEFPGFRHPACHLAGAYHPSSGKTGPAPSARGWHDAGDYGRYVVNSGIATGTLLWAWEMFPQSFAGSLHLPESGNGTPDLLNEIRWNLDWMLSMQDRDGGVWQKQTSESFAEFVAPEKDSLVSKIIGTGQAPYKSSCATADLSTVAAIAGRAYRPFDPDYAARCLRAGRAAWQWVEKNPNVLFHNPPGVTTGEYGDTDCGDEHLWASAELWRTTQDSAYERYFLDHFQKYLDTLRSVNPQAWDRVAPLALWTYVFAPGANPAAASMIREHSLTSADQLVERTNHSPYRNSLTHQDYTWGSNGTAANYGMQLVVANQLHADPRYLEAALDNLHYLLGRNTFSLSWVTQLGENSARHPHHRPSWNGLPWPGLLVGGPNWYRQDSVMRTLPDLPPARIYRDNQDSFSTNEVAINWNAPLVFVLAAVERSGQ